MTLVAIHQPNYLPWIGTFIKIARCDRFIVLDDAQYTKGGFINRNRIKTPQGPAWLSIPVCLKGRFGLPVNRVPVAHGDRWVAVHRKTLQANYGRAPYFDVVMKDVLDPILRSDGPHWSDLAALNTALIERICAFLEIRTPMVNASRHGLDSRSTERLVDLVRAEGGTAYLSGRGGDRYQDAGRFDQAGIDLVYNDFDHPRYAQMWGDFVPGLSIIDLLFCRGRSAADVLRSAAGATRPAPSPALVALEV